MTFYPHRGATVATISYEEAREMAEIQIALEFLALRLAIPNMTEEGLQQVEEIINWGDTEEDISAYSKLNWQFHEP